MTVKKTGSGKLSDILADMNEQGGFMISILTDQEGLPLASASTEDGENPDMQAAVVALIQRTAQQTQKVHMGITDEVAVHDRQGRLLICRPFQAGGRTLVLAAMAPRQLSYRRLTSQAIVAVREAWNI